MDAASAESYAGGRSEIPVRRVGRVDEIAAACTYLAGAGFITGQVLHVNGGDAMLLGAFRIK
jgi:NAD(P)-dependent dehydrogenase (short-subunit alcohol dehydrogenase family)